MLAQIPRASNQPCFDSQLGEIHKSETPSPGEMEGATGDFRGVIFPLVPQHKFTSSFGCPHSTFLNTQVARERFHCHPGPGSASKPQPGITAINQRGQQWQTQRYLASRFKEAFEVFPCVVKSSRPTGQGRNTGGPQLMLMVEVQGLIILWDVTVRNALMQEKVK